MVALGRQWRIFRPLESHLGDSSMIGAAIGFIELGGLVLAWVIFWNYILRGFTAAHTGSPAIQGLAAVYHA